MLTEVNYFQLNIKCRKFYLQSSWMRNTLEIMNIGFVLVNLGFGNFDFLIV